MKTMFDEILLGFVLADDTGGLGTPQVLTELTTMSPNRITYI